MRYKNLYFLCLVLVSICACQKDNSIVEQASYSDSDYRIISEKLNLPITIDDYKFDFSSFGDRLSNQKATLGRVLFYDKNLSLDGAVSCASCHKQELAFADDVAFSEGVSNNHTERNSIALGSLKSFDSEYRVQEESPGLFWDERVQTVKAQMEQTFENENEMGMDITQLKSIVEQEPHYQVLFRKALSTHDIDADKILHAIEVFVRSIKSSNSKFDKAVVTNSSFVGATFEEDWRGLNEQENRGKLLFHNHCQSCHRLVDEPFDMSRLPRKSVANNGLDLRYKDTGVANISNDENDRGKFKIPGLRNIELTAPYMHDGRFNSLEEVINFYNEDIQAHPNLNKALKDENGNPKQLHLNNSEKKDLEAFLKTLTDHTLAKATRWSDPFKE